jgi:hypothetical protein
VPASQPMTEVIGYTWDQSAVPRDVPRFSVERAVWRFRRSLPEYVWDAAVLEGNPFTYPEVQTLLDGITVGGRKISDEQQVLNLAEAANELLQLVKAREFRLDKEISDRLQYLRGEGKELLRRIYARALSSSTPILATSSSRLSRISCSPPCGSSTSTGTSAPPGT